MSELTQGICGKISISVDDFLRPIIRLIKADSHFVDVFEIVSDDVHKTAIDKGWWDKPRSNGEIIALIHSELSEALEALRIGNQPDKHCPEFSSVEAELADVIIRIMDLATERGWRVAEALVAKAEFNKTRQHKHGGKEF